MLNTVIQGDCLDVLKTLPDGCIDLTVTSPPYDNLRTYNGYTFDFEGIARELYRVTKQGGVVVWVVGDETIKGSETGTSFRQALYFKECGFNLHDTMIYKMAGTGAKGSNLSYWQSFDYMFVFSKGKIQTVNRLKDKINVKAGSTIKKSSPKTTIVGTRKTEKPRTVQKFGIRDNVWVYGTGGTNTGTGKQTAPFPEALARDHILSWSNEGDTVLDPMAGSGTTLKMAKQNGRNYIGIEISPEYVEIINQRLTDEVSG